MKNQINLVLATLTLTVLGCVCPGKNTPSSTTPPTEVQTTRSPAPSPTDEKAIEISSVQLAKEYDANELAADTKYEGKKISVTGKLAGITKVYGSVQLDLVGKQSYSINIFQ